MKRIWYLTMAILFLTCWAHSAQAQQGVGLRAGVSVDPEQFYFGGHVTTAPVIDRLRFRPNVEIGFSSNNTNIGLNGEFAYFMPLRRSDANVYLGAGPALNIFSRGPSGSRSTSTGPGFNFLVGAEHDRGWFAEAKVGALDSPVFKFAVGYTFRGR
jgi:hypothetical protein